MCIFVTTREVRGRDRLFRCCELAMHEKRPGSRLAVTAALSGSYHKDPGSAGGYLPVLELYSSIEEAMISKSLTIGDDPQNRPLIILKLGTAGQNRPVIDAATRRACAYSISASSSAGMIGVKSRCAIQSGRVNLVM
jgi:hypothetical protein